MRAVPLLLAATLALAACAPGADLVAVPVLGRGLLDIPASAISGRDCSVVRLDAGQTYCAPRYDVGREQPFCTRTLGAPTCWETPALLAAPQTELGDTPPPTPDQLRYRAAPWPKSLFF